MELLAFDQQCSSLKLRRWFQSIYRQKYHRINPRIANFPQFSLLKIFKNKLVFFPPKMAISPDFWIVVNINDSTVESDRESEYKLGFWFP